MKKEAYYYNKDSHGKVVCTLCPHNCSIVEGKNGICGTRKVEQDILYSLNYGEITSVGLDHIEKKPLYHFKPGNFILSVGSFGCNFKCSFCQNYSISQYKAKSYSVSPEDLIYSALHMEKNIGIAFTYNEPSIWYEFVFDVARKAYGTNLDIVLVTNGYINKQPFEEILPYVSAVNIDLKAFTNTFYKQICSGELDKVLLSIKNSSSKCHLEITTLLVNGYNDSDEEIKNLSKWLSQVNPNIPLHLSRYYPAYNFKAKLTPKERILYCRDIAREYLNYVYVGNINDVDNNTYCPECHEVLVERFNYDTIYSIIENKCPNCGCKINIVP